MYVHISPQQATVIKIAIQRKWNGGIVTYNKPKQLYCPKYGLSVFAWKTLGIIRRTHQVSHGSGHQLVLVSLEESQYIVPPYTQCCHVDESEWHWEELLDFHILETFLEIKIKCNLSIWHFIVPAIIMLFDFPLKHILIPDTSFLRKNTMRKKTAINTSPMMVPTTIPAVVPDDRAVELDRLQVRIAVYYTKYWGLGGEATDCSLCKHCGCMLNTDYIWLRKSSSSEKTHSLWTETEN